MVVKMSCEQPDQSESRKQIGYSNERSSLMICKDDNSMGLSELLSERVSRQKQIIRGKYMNSHLLEIVSGCRNQHNNDNRPKPITPVEVLQELFELLEDCSPIWYTQENHDRAVAVLGAAPLRQNPCAFDSRLIFMLDHSLHSRSEAEIVALYFLAEENLGINDAVPR